MGITIVHYRIHSGRDQLIGILFPQGLKPPSLNTTFRFRISRVAVVVCGQNLPTRCRC